MNWNASLVLLVQPFLNLFHFFVECEKELVLEFPLAVGHTIDSCILVGAFQKQRFGILPIQVVVRLQFCSKCDASFSSVPSESL